MSEVSYVLGRVMVLPLLEDKPGLHAAVKELYEERDDLRAKLEQSNRVIEYLLNGGDRSVIQKVGG